jgi:alpha-1,2-mannosyltransferase
VWLAGRGRWWLACALLVVTLLLKPLLLPLVLIPFLARRWRPAIVCLAAGGLALVASIPLAGGLSRATDVVKLLARGSTLTDQFAAYNLSLHAIGAAHGVPTLAIAAARALVLAAVVIAVVIVVRRQRVWDVPAVAWLAMLLQLALFMAGNLSEGHYVLTLVPGIVAVIARSTSLAARLLAAAGLVLLALPPLGLGNLPTQALYVGIEVLLFVSAFLATLRGVHRRQEPPPAPEPVPAPRAAEPDRVRTPSPEPRPASA